MTEPCAKTYGRVGTVTAVRLDAARDWTTSAGDRLRGEAGDWLITSPDGGLRTAKDEQFRRSYERVDGDTWRRTGTVRAWQTREPLTVATLEGNATADPGDWIVTAPDGSSWPVPDKVFRASYAELHP